MTASGLFICAQALTVKPKRTAWKTYPQPLLQLLATSHVAWSIEGASWSIKHVIRSIQNHMDYQRCSQFHGKCFKCYVICSMADQSRFDFPPKRTSQAHPPSGPPKRTGPPKRSSQADPPSGSPSGPPKRTPQSDNQNKQNVLLGTKTMIMNKDERH